MRRILILEDNTEMRRYLCKIIDGLNKNVEVYCTDNIKEAYSLAMENRIQLFLLDIVLDHSNPGDVSGLNFAQEMRNVKRYEYVPIIFITMLQDPKLFSFKNLKCFDFIEKPFDEKIVRENILKALDVPLAEEEERIVFYRKDGIAFSMDPDEIYYIDVRRRSLTVYCVSGVMEVPYKTCKEILKEIGSKFFTQCSRYTIINKRYIEYIDYASRYVKIKGIKEYIEIGAVIKNKFKAEMDEWSF